MHRKNLSSFLSRRFRYKETGIKLIKKRAGVNLITHRESPFPNSY